MPKLSKTISLSVLIAVFAVTLLSANNAQAGFWEFILPKRFENLFNLDTTPPPTPLNIAVSSSNGQAHLRWDPVFVSDLAYYEIKGESITGKLETQQSYDASLTWRNLTNDVAYTFQIAAIDQNNLRSEWSTSLISTPTAAASTAIQTQGFEVAAWMPTNWDVSDARSSFENNRSLFTYISPFWYDQAGSGSLSAKGGARDQSLISSAHAKNIKVIPSITNNYSQSKAQTLLNSTDNRQRAISAIIGEVTKYNYDGIDMDFENVRPQDKEVYSSFIEELARELHSRKKSLHVTVQPKINENYSWSGPGGMDYARLGKAADRIRIMTYDFSRLNTTPGPIAPLSWMHSVIQYAKSQIASHKILIGIPFYGYDWGLGSADNKSSGLVWDGVLNTKRQYSVTEHWDAKSGEPWYEYQGSAGKNIAYYQDHRSVDLKVELAYNERVGGISIWRLGSEDPKNFSAINKYTSSTASYKLEAPQNLTIQPQSHSLTVRFLHPAGEAKISKYILKYGTDPARLDKRVDLGKNTEYTLNNIEAGKFYYFLVFAEGENQISPASGMVGASVSNVDLSILEPQLAIHSEQENELQLIASVGKGSNLPANKLELTGSVGIWESGALATQNHNWETSFEQKEKEQVLIKIKGLSTEQAYSFMVGGRDAQDKVLPYSNVLHWNKDKSVTVDSPKDVQVRKENGQLMIEWQASGSDVIGYDVSVTEGILRHEPFFVGPRLSLSLSDSYLSDMLFIGVRARTANGQVSQYELTTYLPVDFD
ncbi:glycosyl hydrolase family 18 protein [Patescibacteria group bacterium]